LAAGWTNKNLKNEKQQNIMKIQMQNFIIIIIIIYLSCSWTTCCPVPVSRNQKSLQKSAMIPSAIWGIVFYYPG
jgi:hypothetical protein